MRQLAIQPQRCLTGQSCCKALNKAKAAQQHNTHRAFSSRHLHHNHNHNHKSNNCHDNLLVSKNFIHIQFFYFIFESFRIVCCCVSAMQITLEQFQKFELLVLALYPNDAEISSSICERVVSSPFLSPAFGNLLEMSLTI
jgi:hypothetical protein